MPQSTDLSELVRQYSGEVNSRIETLTADAAAGGFDAAIDLMVNAIEAGGVIQAFGTGHSEAFAMEIAGRAGGLIPTNKIALRDVVLRGSRDLGDADRIGIGAEPVRRRRTVRDLPDRSGRRVHHRVEFRRQRIHRRSGAEGQGRPGTSSSP